MDFKCWERPKADPSPSAKGLQGPLGGGFWKEGLATTQAFGLLRDAFPFCSPQGPLQTNAKNCLAPKEPIFFCIYASRSNKFGNSHRCKKRLRYSSKPSNSLCLCGRRGIRTPGSVKINGFQDRRNRPLCHPSSRVQLPVTPSCRAERRGFEPLKRFWRLLTFQASQFNHSCTFPFRADKGR